MQLDNSTDRVGGGRWQNVIGELIALTVSEGEDAERDWCIDRTDRVEEGGW